MDLKRKLEELMKKILVFLFIALVFFGSCSEQNVNAQSANDAQRIVGTWRAGTSTFTFNADGTLVFMDRDGSSQNTDYFLNNGKLIIRHNTAVFDFYLSPNGRNLVLFVTVTAGSGNLYSGFFNRYWFDKQ